MGEMTKKKIVNITSWWWWSWWRFMHLFGSQVFCFCFCFVVQALRIWLKLNWDSMDHPKRESERDIQSFITKNKAWMNEQTCYYYEHNNVPEIHPFTLLFVLWKTKQIDVDEKDNGGWCVVTIIIARVQLVISTIDKKNIYFGKKLATQSFCGGC